MKKLIISANPSSKSFTNLIAKKLYELSIEIGHELEIIDLYNTELKQDFLSYEDKKEIGKDNISKKIQQKILASDEIVLIFPIWWGDAPAILKNFWDSNFVSHFAYMYDKGGKKIGLLKGKQVRIITTAGGSSFYFKYIFRLPFFWKYSKIHFCGMKMKSFTIFGNIDKTGTQKDKYLNKLYKLI